jgi:hypothetical protein
MAAQTQAPAIPFPAQQLSLAQLLTNTAEKLSLKFRITLTNEI